MSPSKKTREAFITDYISTLPEPHRKALQAAIDAGWRLETDWRKIHARYKDLDYAGKVPRNLIYVDLGVLIARLTRYEQLLVEAGFKIVEEE